MEGGNIMPFNLKQMRERKGFSQQEFADALNSKWGAVHPDDRHHFTVDMVIRMEKDPDRISLDVLGPITQVFGVTYDQLLTPCIPRLESPHVKNNWSRIEKIRESIEKYIQKYAPKYLSDNHPEMLLTLQELKERTARKPKIACMGRPDSGKSRTLNTLIGRDILPTNWTPTTSTVVYLKHLADKPDYFGADTVWILKEEEKDFWNPDNINDEEYCRKWCIAAGDYSLISRYGAHDGKEDETVVGAIVAFVDSPILYNCDFIDLPGFNPQTVIDKQEEAQVDDIYDSRDSMLSARASRMADGYIYLSIANSFLYGDDLAMAQSVAKSLPAIEKKNENKVRPLGNLFFVASQALTVNHGDKDALGEICDKAANRIWNMIHDHPAIDRRSEQTGYTYSEKTLRSRFFTSEMDSADLTQRFYSELVAFLEALPAIQEKKLLEELRLYCFSQKNYFQDAAKQSQLILENQRAALEQLREMEKNEAARSAQFRQNIYQVTDAIQIMKHDSENEVILAYNDVVNAANIIQIIEKRKLKKNKRDLQELVTILNASLENRITTILTDKSLLLKDRIDAFLNECQFSFTKAKAARPDVDGIPVVFNIGRAFAGGLSGLLAYGALSAWAATCGNLGGYILVGKAVSLLASVGIHVGGTAAVISSVSAIGGPVILGITIASIAAVTAILALGGTWKKLIGNKLVKQYQKKNVLDKLKEATDGFWNDTLNAFRQGTEKVESEWLSQLEMFREKVKDFDPEALRSDIGNAQMAADFFEGLIEKAAD